MIKKKPTKKHAKKKAVKKRAVKKISGVHKDTKSHNVKINVLSGLNSTTTAAINKRVEMYGNLAKTLLNVKTKTDAKKIRNQMQGLKTEINILKKLKH